ncbi:hypothetical protein [Effusibacillus lacus]|uniref:hypothetical protein n=1 Tax=Effusibacillus lacus TaxID=1348429 RepID=UPI0010521F77|nr:hypothetical protein [Effusibacillus lacus]
MIPASQQALTPVRGRLPRLVASKISGNYIRAVQEFLSGAAHDDVPGFHAPVAMVRAISRRLYIGQGDS